MRRILSTISTLYTQIKPETLPLLVILSFVRKLKENVLAETDKKFKRGPHTEIHLPSPKVKYKGSMKLPLDIPNQRSTYILFCTCTSLTTNYNI